MSVEPRLIFLNSQQVASPNLLESTLSVFQVLGFDICSLKVGNYPKEVGAWDGYSDSKADVLAVASQHKQLTFNVINTEESFELLMQLGWGREHLGKESRLWLSATCFQTPLFNYGKEDSKHYSQLFLNVGKHLYEVLQPVFGCIEMTTGLADNMSFEDVEELALPHLCWANFFSAAYVEKIGRSYILNAPAWNIEDLSDGGLLYVLSSGPGLAGEEDHVSVSAVKEYFGVQSIR